MGTHLLELGALAITAVFQAYAARELRLIRGSTDRGEDRGKHKDMIDSVLDRRIT